MPILQLVIQDRARSDVIEGLTESVVLLERNWAMKFLPMMYREFHSKLFGKRELNCLISVGTYKTDEVIHSHTIFHVFDNARQNTTTSNAILKDCVDRLNAGCFHSVEGISK